MDRMLERERQKGNRGVILISFSYSCHCCKIKITSLIKNKINNFTQCLQLIQIQIHISIYKDYLYFLPNSSQIQGLQEILVTLTHSRIQHGMRIMTILQGIMMPRIHAEFPPVVVLCAWTVGLRTTWKGGSVWAAGVVKDVRPLMLSIAERNPLGVHLVSPSRKMCSESAKISVPLNLEENKNKNWASNSDLKREIERICI